MGEGSPIKGEYDELATVRTVYLDRARENARLTIPSLIPPDTTRNSGRRLPQPPHSIGARGVNNLAAKLLISLFPSNTPVFRMVIDDFEIEKMVENAPKKGKGEIQKALNKIERSGMQELDALGARAPIGLALKHLLVAGNYLLHMNASTGEIRGYPLSHYVCQRDSMGNPMKIIIEETVAVSSLPDHIREAHLIKSKIEGKDKPDKEVLAYTHIEKQFNGSWKVRYEVCGKELTDRAGSYPKDKCEFIPLRLIPVEGEDYGRSMVEDLWGDLVSANNLRDALVKFAKAASKVLFMVKPNAATRVRVLTAAQAGDFVAGDTDDVKPLQLEKSQDFRVAQEVLADVTRSLEFSFLLQSAAARDAERVTAEEVRQVIQELDAGLGGMHSALSADLQLPFVKLLLWRMEKLKKFKLPKSIKPAIVTGVAALGRGQDRANLASAFQDFNQLAQVPPQILQKMNLDELIARVYAANNVDPLGLMMSDEEQLAADQKAQLQNLLQNAGPGAIQELTKGVVQGQLQDNQPQG
ncbi:portal protein